MDAGSAQGQGARRRAAAAVPGLLALAAALLTALLAWFRLLQGVDLENESGWLVVPWRWALGDTPFLDEENLAQVTSFLVYPFIKVFALVGGGDVTGLVLYGRHLYLGLTLVVAVVAFLVLRRFVRWQLALLVAALCIALLAVETPQINSTSLAAALLTLGAVLGLRSVSAPPARGWALASGVAYGLSVVAYPTLLFVVPFFAVFLAFALGRRTVAVLESGAFVHPPDPPGPPTGRNAWLVLSAWALGGVLVLVPVSLILAAFGPANLVRCWHYTLTIGRNLGQLGGATKAYEVTSGFLALVWSRPYLLAAAVAVYLVERRWPLPGRALLAGLPLALWLAARRPGHDATDLLLLAAAVAPYCYLFLPHERRADAARMLIWVWSPTLLAGAMAAYTSSLGYTHASMAVLPAMLTSAVFVAWALESVGGTARRFPWLAFAVLAALLGFVVGPQLQRAVVGVPQATATFTAGPWWGIRAPVDQRAFLTRLAADLGAYATPDKSLLVFWGGSGTYLLWPGDVATNSYWIRMGRGGELGTLPTATIAALRRRHIVPDVVVHFTDTTGLSAAELRAGSGGLDYPPALVRPEYVIHEKPAGETTQQVLRRLRR